jgi:S1-C subfamily serine protease
MVRLGRPNRPPRPWLGIYATEAGAKLAIAGLAPGGPAERAGVQVGDLVAEVGGTRPTSLADLFRRIRRCGTAGCEVALKLVREGKLVDARVVSGDRADFLKKPHLH